MSTLTDMEAFAVIVELQSFTKAAEKIGISKSYASKILSRLEHKIGVKLLYRSTRKLSLTEAGSRFYSQCKEIKMLADNALDEVSWHQDIVKGTLKITTPAALATKVLPQIIEKINIIYPILKYEVYASNDLIDIVDAGIDLAIRMGPLLSSELIAKKICMVPMYLCVSPKYIKKNSLPNTIYQLVEHQLSLYSLYSKKRDYWTFIQDGETIHLQVAPFVKSNNSDLLKEMTLSGECISVLPSYLIKNELESGELLEILPQVKLQSEPLYAVYHNREFISKKASVFIEELKLFFRNYEK